MVVVVVDVVERGRGRWTPVRISCCLLVIDVCSGW